jgi:hypothetical protein
MAQVVNVIDCGKRLVQTSLTQEDGSVVYSDSYIYYLQGSPYTSSEWDGDAAHEEPFTMSSPWDYIFKSLIDIYGATFIGKTVTLDVSDVDGNILKVR